MPQASASRRTDPKPDDYSYSYKPPTFTETQMNDLRRAAGTYAERHASDPFAFGRMMMLLKRGIENPSEVQSRWTKRAADDLAAVEAI